MYDDDALEDALATLAPFGPDLANGMTSHAPMTAEALAALGRGDAIAPWIARYRPLLLPRPRPTSRIDPVRWRDALGREGRAADWSAFFAEELANTPWTELLARWTARLAPGLCAAATHGPIRVAHAARALGRAETALRRAELAEALGYWAATFQTLPSRSGVARPGGARAALARVARVPLAARRFDGTISGALAALDAHAPFAAAIDLFDASAPADDAIAELAEAFARVFLANAQDGLSAIVFVHGVTSVAALRSLVPHLDARAARETLRHAWQAGAALYAAFGTAAPLADELEAAGPSRDELVERAVAHGDEHAIKMVEACLVADASAPSPVFRAAAQRAIERIPR